MATSGSIQNTFTAGFTLKMQWATQSQDIVNNTSSVKCDLLLITGSGASMSASATKNVSMVINGITYTGTVVIGTLGANQTKTLMSKTVTIAHNTDGTKTFSYSGTTELKAILNGSLVSSASVSGGSGTLNNIPRNSTISSVTSPVAVNGSNTCTVNINRSVSSYLHMVTWSFGSYSYTLQSVATQASYAIPTSWLTAMPNTTSGTATVTVSTFSGNTQIGATVSKTFTVQVPSTIVPTIGNLEIVATDNKVPESWGFFVQGISKVQVKITGAQAYNGATIANSAISGMGYSSTTNTLNTSELWDTNSPIFTGKVTDSRGRVGTRSKTITIREYTKPYWGHETSYFYRADATGTKNEDGTYIAIKVAANYSSLGGKNTLSAKVKYKKVTQDNYGTEITVPINTQSVIGGGLIDVDYAYDIVITLEDQFNKITVPGFIESGYSTMDLLKGGKGIAFGKTAVEEVFDVGMDALFRKKITLDNIADTQDKYSLIIEPGISNAASEIPKVRVAATGDMDIVTEEELSFNGVKATLLAYPIGSIYMSTNVTSPAARFGGGWEQLKDRFLLGAGSTYSVGTTGGASTQTLNMTHMPPNVVGTSGPERYGVPNGSYYMLAWGPSTTERNRPFSILPPYLTVYMWKRVS